PRFGAPARADRGSVHPACVAPGARSPLVTRTKASCSSRSPCPRPFEQRRKVAYSRAMRLHLVDGTYELFRAYFSKRPPHRAPDGSDKKATLALAFSMLALMHDEGESVTHVAVAFDNPIRSFRNDLFDGYKTEEGVPPEDRKSTRLNSSHVAISYAVFCLKKK